MAESSARKLLSPADQRYALRGGVIQIWVTRACDKACFACTQGSNLGGKPGFISLSQFEEACRSLKGYWGVVGVFGGNPALHPQFEDLCEILARYFSIEQRGIWCNHPKGKGALMARIFNPALSNLNVHLDQEAKAEFERDWPESVQYLKGVDSDSRHASPFVALKDVIESEEERWRLIADCDVNKYWSAMVCVVRGKVKGYFCEIAAAQAMLHENDPDWPDLGHDAVEGWWNRQIEAFSEQVNFYCHRCGVPLKAKGELAINGETEFVSETHQLIYKPKVRGRPVSVVVNRNTIQIRGVNRATEYIANSKL